MADYAVAVNYRSFTDLAADVRAWSDQLPRDIDLVVGIPRSGMLPATLLAVHRNLPLADFDGFLAGLRSGSGKRLSTGDVTPGVRRVLVVDDTINSGASMKAAQERALEHDPHTDTLWGAVYRSQNTPPDVVDVWFAQVDWPRVFEWNIFHHGGARDFCFDIDGVLCRDPTERENDDGPEYERFIRDVEVRFVPGAEIGWLVTSRLERHRAETEGWLRRAGIRYRHLVMHPAPTAQERRAAGDHARRKGQFYKSVPARLFVESDPGQARHIADGSGKPVFCVENAMMVYPHQPMNHGTVPDLRNRTRWRLRRLRGSIYWRMKRAARRLTTR